ncbi:oxysterol-binding protein-related protein 4C-like [Wolffia australiana]
MKLTNFGESYEMNSPSMVINLLPVPGAEWAGKVSIVCRESGLEAELRYHQRRTFFFGFGSTPGVIKGRIFHSKSLTTIYEIDGRWNKKVTIKDVHSGEVRVLYDAVENISRLKTPVVRNPHAVAVTESAAVWGKVSGEILRRNWGGAAKLKAAVEERERGKAATRTTWEPQFFHLRPKKEGGWSCRPKLAAVPAAPITADL